MYTTSSVGRSVLNSSHLCEVMIDQNLYIRVDEGENAGRMDFSRPGQGMSLKQKRRSWGRGLGHNGEGGVTNGDGYVHKRPSGFSTCLCFRVVFWHDMHRPLPSVTCGFERESKFCSQRQFFVESVVS